ncbi:MAG: hypothetical protein QM714_06325 [Nocardioides sp.]|uniref:hypothetical protein n=1 Tax=Nocardioides sp. TaxID=35761 RepID=UPI0039E71940
MEEVLALTADHTHLYPGARLTVPETSALPSESADVIVLFRDHSTAEAVLTRSGEGFELRVEPYSTVAGTAIDTKTWRLAATEDGSLVVRRR